MASPTIFKSGMAPVTCIAPIGGVTVDVPVLIGSLFGIPAKTVAAGESFELQCHFQASLPKSGVAMSAGDRLYWDGTQFTKTVTDDDVGAVCITDAGAGATTVEVEVGCPCKANVQTGAAVADAAADTAPGAGLGSGADATTFSGAECDALVADVADIRTQLNDLLASLRASKAIAT